MAKGKKGRGIRGHPPRRPAVKGLRAIPSFERESAPAYRTAPQSFLHAIQNDELWRRWKADDAHSVDLRRVDLRGLDLRHKDLTGLDFSGSCLQEAKLCEACLYNVNLIDADLRSADLSDAQLAGAILLRTNLASSNLSRADFRRAGVDVRVFQQATRGSMWWGGGINGLAAFGIEMYYDEVLGGNTYLVEANMSRCDMHGTKLAGANLTGANLEEAVMRNVDLSRAILDKCSLAGATLLDVNLEFARIVKANLASATLRNCSVYGVSCWDVSTDARTEQDELVIQEHPRLTVPTLDIAQFVYLLLNNNNVRHVIETLSTKVVLILGRFSPERKAVLDQLRHALRRRDYVPIIFDCEGPRTRDTQETITTLARLARAIIADISDARSVPQELVTIVESLPSVPVVPILQRGFKPWGMYDHISRYPWVKPLLEYEPPGSKLSSHFVDDIVLQMQCSVHGSAKP